MIHDFSHDLRRWITLCESMVITNSPEFQAWFAGSKVVDKQGNPQRMYHATEENFDTFWPWSHFGTATAANQRLADRQTDYEKGAAYGHIIPVYLQITNPLRVSDQESSDEATFLNAIVRRKYGGIDMNTARRQGVRRALTNAGYDGLVYRNRMEDRGRNSWVVFDKSQVRSAISSESDE